MHIKCYRGEMNLMRKSVIKDVKGTYNLVIRPMSGDCFY